jgi:hypothetical protein
MGIQDFVAGLKSLGFDDAQDIGNGRVVLTYAILVGRFAGQTVKMGFIGVNDFPLNPPGGPRVSPRLFTIHPKDDLPHPEGGVHEALEFEAAQGQTNWQYWSRPHRTWAETDRSVRAYMRHINTLFAGIK